VPAPPFVTSAKTPESVVQALASALEHVVQSHPDRAVLDALGLRGISRLDATAYRPIAELAKAARAVDYRELNLEGA
jgi:ABC-type phosphate/phosphonate transport system substrate-binding protein